MARRQSEPKLDSREARRRLPHRTKPYFCLVAAGAFPIHLGFYRQADNRPGTWIARRYVGEGRYETERLGRADDDKNLPANGVDVLDFDQAKVATTNWAKRQIATARSEAEAAASATVRAVVESYIAHRKAQSPRAGRDAELKLSHHVLSAPLADIKLAAVTRDHLAQWRRGLRRGGRGSRDKSLPLADASLKRLFNDLRAALRRAEPPADVLAAIGKVLAIPESANRVRAKQVLPDADVRRIVEAAYRQDEDFGALVLVLAATGCRFDQAARMTVADLQISNGRIMVPVSDKGSRAKEQSHIAVPLPDDVLARLRLLTAGRRGHEPLLTRWHHRQIEGDRKAGRLPGWERVDRRAWATASEMSRPWRAAVAAAELPETLVPYCLRHSAIVRGLKNGLPVRLVAAAADTSIAMIERHYGLFIVDASEELLRRAAVPLAPAAVASLVAARAAKAGT